VIGNIPFGNYPVHDPAYKNSPVTRTIHDYFLAKSLDKLRAGGVMALITSRYTMDKQDSTMRCQRRGMPNCFFYRCFTSLLVRP
jgi:hypothetical protein